MSYRPITDFWLMARPKVKYYGAYPSGFLERGRALIGVNMNETVLHVCSGMIRAYPFRGLGPNDKTVDIDLMLKPDYCMDVRKELPTHLPEGWPAMMVDRPYSESDADKYACGRGVLPPANQLLKDCLDKVRVCGRVGFLDYVAPRPPRKNVKLVAMVAVSVGYANKLRCYSVFERLK